MRRSLVPSTVLFASLIGIGPLFGQTSTGGCAENYTVDALHSSVLFRVKHLDVSYFYGRFNKMSGSFVYDESEAGNCAFDVTLNAQSIDTNDTKRDKHLKSPDFFSAKEFPTITFKSTAVKSAEPGSYEVTGDLTLHGVTKPASVALEHTGSGKGRGGSFLRGFEGSFTIKRSDYGMSTMLGGLGDEVTIKVSLEGVRQ